MTTPELLKISRERLTHLLGKKATANKEDGNYCGLPAFERLQLTPEKFSMLQGMLEQAAKQNVLSAQMLLGERLRKAIPNKL